MYMMILGAKNLQSWREKWGITFWCYQTACSRKTSTESVHLQPKPCVDREHNKWGRCSLGRCSFAWWFSERTAYGFDAFFYGWFRYNNWKKSMWCQTHLILIWCLFDTHLILIWYSFDTYLILIWYSFDTHLILIWYSCIIVILYSYVIYIIVMYHYSVCVYIQLTRLYTVR